MVRHQPHPRLAPAWAEAESVARPRSRMLEARGAASSTRGTPNDGGVKRSITVPGMLACEGQIESIACVACPPNLRRGRREPPMAWKPSGWTASGAVSTLTTACAAPPGTPCRHCITGKPEGLESGGGRPPRPGTEPALLRDREALIGPGMRGDPRSPLRWTGMSTRERARTLEAREQWISRQIGARYCNNSRTACKRRARRWKGAAIRVGCEKQERG